MPVPFFFSDSIPAKGLSLLLEPDSSKHIAQVLRMRTGESIQLTDGKGLLAMAQIEKADRKACEVYITETRFKKKEIPEITLAVSLLKHHGRFEWLLEKATELGVHKIIPLLCERTERQHFRLERLNGVLQSAMLQSMQVWLPVMEEPVPFDDFFPQELDQLNFMAHCTDLEKTELAGYIFAHRQDRIKAMTMMIGPEGDFTEKEIRTAMDKRAIPVSLGQNRLRTETAAITAIGLLRLGFPPVH